MKIFLLAFSPFIVFIFFKLWPHIFIAIVLLTAPREKISKSMQDEHTIYHNFTAEINRKYSFEGGIVGTRHNLDEEKTEGLSFDFEKKGKYNKDQAREISIPMLLECLAGINKNTNLAKYLLPFPFTTHNINVTVGFPNQFGFNHEFEPYIGKTLFVKNKLVYYVYPRCGEGKSYQEEEVFDEAYNKIKDNLSPQLRKIAEDSIELLKIRKSTEEPPEDYPDDEHHPVRVAIREMIERAKA